MDKELIANAKRLYQEGTPLDKPLTVPERDLEREQTLNWALNKLVSYGSLNDPSAIADWKEDLADLSARELMQGVLKAKDRTGYMLIGDFREMCWIRKPTVYWKNEDNIPMGADAHHKKTLEMKKRLGM